MVWTNLDRRWRALLKKMITDLHNITSIHFTICKAITSQNTHFKIKHIFLATKILNKTTYVDANAWLQALFLE